MLLEFTFWQPNPIDAVGYRCSVGPSLGNHIAMMNVPTLSDSLAAPCLCQEPFTTPSTEMRDYRA